MPKAVEEMDAMAQDPPNNDDATPGIIEEGEAAAAVPRKRNKATKRNVLAAEKTIIELALVDFHSLKNSSETRVSRASEKSRTEQVDLGVTNFIGKRLGEGDIKRNRVDQLISDAALVASWEAYPEKSSSGSKKKKTLLKCKKELIWE